MISKIQEIQEKYKKKKKKKKTKIWEISQSQGVNQSFWVYSMISVEENGRKKKKKN